MLETDCKGGFLFKIVTLKLISMVSWALCLCFIFLFVFCFFKLFLIEEWLLYNTGLVSAIPRLAIGTHMSPPSWIFPPPTLSLPSRLLQSPSLSSLSSTSSFPWLSILQCLFICLAVPGLSCSTQISLQHSDPLVVLRLSSWQLVGLVAPQHMGSSQTRDQTHVPCITRWILNHWTTREIPWLCFRSIPSLFPAPAELLVRDSECWCLHGLQLRT